MPGGSIAEVQAAPRLGELLRNVDSMRPFVVDRMRGRPDEVDQVLQLIRETVWHRADVYDPDMGCPDAFVFGITRNVVRRQLAKRTDQVEELPEDVPSSKAPDPLGVLVRRFDAQRWMSFVADFVGATDWAVVTELALNDGDTAAVAETHHLSERSLRTIRDRVALTAHTVRAALAVTDADLPLTGSIVLGCLPDRASLREVAAMLNDDAETIAETLHIHPGSARARIATVKRLLTIARTVLDRESSE